MPSSFCQHHDHILHSTMHHFVKTCRKGALLSRGISPSITSRRSCRISFLITCFWILSSNFTTVSADFCVSKTMPASGLPHNSSLPCPAKCICNCKDGGLRVDCSGQNLTEVPKDIHPETKHLDLSVNNISSIPKDAFANLTSLQDLHLGNNFLKGLHMKIFKNNPMLSTLHLQGNLFTSVPPRALQHLNLLLQLMSLFEGKTLVNTVTLWDSQKHLDANQIKRAPDYCFLNLKRLTHLWLDSNHLNKIPVRALSPLVNLQAITLAVNNITVIPNYAFANLSRLQVLLLQENKIEKIEDFAFQGLRSLRSLDLNKNRLRQIPASLYHVMDATEISLAVNNITVIPNYAFANLSRLCILRLNENRIEKIEDFAFFGLESLQEFELLYIQIKLCYGYYNSMLHSRELSSNRLTHMPAALHHLVELIEINLEENQLQSIPDNSFVGNSKLTILHLHKNPILNIGTRAFRNLPSLDKITISEVRDMFTFPDLSGTLNLTHIRLDRASIQVIPPGFCHNMSILKTFDVHSNKITMIPDMSTCVKLLTLNLGNNFITTLEGRPFNGLVELRDLTLNFNYISEIPADAFTGLPKLQYLDLSYNQITKIDPSAFLPLIALEDLNVGSNQLRSLPTRGLQSVMKLKTFENPALREFPPKEAFPQVHMLTLTYAYHCCDFIQDPPKDLGYQELIDEQVTWLDSNDDPPLWQESYNNLTTLWNFHVENHTHNPFTVVSNPVDYGSQEIARPVDYGSQEIARPVDIYPAEYYYDVNGEYVHTMAMNKLPVTCKPKPGPFMPCDDLFGWWSLRCGVWFVFMLALVGNAVVLFVSVTSRSKMDVPRFLICNLACADFFMGVYLGILAIVDASTLGEFRMHAIQWQLSAGCLVAGFLGVLSSELSVFTLTVITLERVYAITHAIQLHKRLSLRRAGYTMFGGWLWAVLLASLPLFGISDYRKFAVCLPFEIEDIFSKIYVCFIMIFNGLSFFVILVCYLAIYLSIRHSQAWNSNDTRVAKRMALLVFTDFLCWAPIAILSLAASFGKNLIDLSEAKVLTIFVLPLNSCANPFLYAIFTKQFKRDCILLCRRLEDSSVARHFSRISHRPVSFAWGSMRRPSQLRALVPVEKGSSCSHSVSGGCIYCNVGNVSGNGVDYHSNPDSRKGSLDYEKLPQTTTPTSCQKQDLSDQRLSICNSAVACDDDVDEDGNSNAGTFDDLADKAVNNLNELLTLKGCNRCFDMEESGGDDWWPCNECSAAQLSPQSRHTDNGCNGNLLQRDTLNFSTVMHQFESNSVQGNSGQRLVCYHPQCKTYHDLQVALSEMRQFKDRNCEDIETGKRGTSSSKETGTGCYTDECISSASLPLSPNSRSRDQGKTLSTVMVCRGKGRQDARYQNTFTDNLSYHKSGTSNKPRPPPTRSDLQNNSIPDEKMLPCRCRSSHPRVPNGQGQTDSEQRHNVKAKPDDQDSGNDGGGDGRSGERGHNSISDNGDLGLDCSDPFEEQGTVLMGGKILAPGFSGEVDKTEHIRFFTNSLRSAQHPHASRANSFVELSDLKHARKAADPCSYTSRQESYLHFSGACSKSSPCINGEEEVSDDTPPEELPRFLHATRPRSGRMRPCDWDAAHHTEVSGLLGGGDVMKPNYVQTKPKSIIKSSNLTLERLRDFISGCEKDSIV